MLSAPTIATFLVMASFAASTGAFFMLPFKRRHLSSTTIMAVSASKKGKLLVLGGTGKICEMTQRLSVVPIVCSDTFPNSELFTHQDSWVKLSASELF